MTKKEKQKIKSKLKYGDVKLLAETIGCSRATVLRWFETDEVKMGIEPYIVKLYELRTQDELKRLESLKLS